MSAPRVSLAVECRAPLDDTVCHRALRSRDARFDGRFFVGVTTTGIYCRPVCRARTPAPANCRFFATAALAEANGFRPCRRCRPELAPGLARIDSEVTLARAAARLIDEQPALTTARLAARLGVSQRHLRRLFHDEFGVRPIEYIQTCRLLTAKRLLTDTQLPVSEIADRAGFSSARRLHASFVQRYGLSPSALRPSRRGAVPRDAAAPDRGESAGAAGPGGPSAHAGSMRALACDLAYVPPYDWPWMLEFLRRRSVAGVEEVAAGRYRRTLRLADACGQAHVGWVEVIPAPGAAALRVLIDARLMPVLQPTLACMRRLLDLACDPARIGAALGPLATARPGIRLPGCADGFELAVRGILGQQVSVRAAHTLAGRIVARFGANVETPFAALIHTFPAAGVIAGTEPATLVELGILAQRARAIVALAQALESGRLDLGPAADPAATVAALQTLPGIGEWTAQYVAMRALSWPDAFPATDLGVMQALATRSRREVLARAEAWRPWRAYAVMHLWSRP